MISSSSAFAILGAGPAKSVLSGKRPIPFTVWTLGSSQYLEWYVTKVESAMKFCIRQIVKRYLSITNVFLYLQLAFFVLLN